MSRPLVDFFTTTRHFTSNSTSQGVFLKTILHTDTSSTRPLLDDFCTATHHFTSNSTTLRINTSSTRPHVDDFCTATRHFTLIRRHKTSYPRQFSASARPRHVLLLTTFARRLTLRLIWRHRRSLSRQLCASTRPRHVLLFQRPLGVRASSLIS